MHASTERALYGPRGELPPKWERCKSVKNTKGTYALSWNSLEGQSNSQTNIMKKSTIGADIVFRHPSEVKFKKLKSRSAAQTGSADMVRSVILNTCCQDNAKKLIDYPRKSRALYNYAQMPHTKEHTIPPPSDMSENNMGVESVTIPNEDQDDIGFNNLDDPNPEYGLPPLDPVEQQGTLQPYRFDGKNLIMPSSGYKRYLGKNQEAGKMRYRSLPDGVSHDQSALVTTAVSNYLWQVQRDGMANLIRKDRKKEDEK